MIGDEVEHQPQAALLQPLAQPSECRSAAEIFMHGVTGDGEAGAGDVFFAQVRQGLLEFLSPLWIGARDLLRREAGLPDAQEPDPIEAHLRQRSNSVSGMSSSVARLPSLRDSSVSQTRVLI